VFTINPATVDYIDIVDTADTGSSSIPDQTVDLNFTITGYAAAFNDTVGYIGDISCAWTVIPSGGENAYTTPPTGTSSTFNSGTVNGSVTWQIDDLSGHTDSVIFTISSGGPTTVDYIKIVDTSGTGATEILDQTVPLWFLSFLLGLFLMQTVQMHPLVHPLAKAQLSMPKMPTVLLHGKLMMVQDMWIQLSLQSIL
jgi:hypothetical protein